MQPSGFEDKLLAKLSKLDHDQVQNTLARILAQKQFLQTIFDHLDEGVIVTDGELAMLFVNRRARSMLGFPRERSLLGESLKDRLDEDHPLHDIIASLVGHPRAIEAYEVAFGPRDDRTLSLSTLPIRTTPAGAPPTGGPAGGGERGEGNGEELLIILLHDVTERARRQAEQARAQRLTSLATLTSGIAHEIKNPLNSLNIHAQILSGEVQRCRREGRPLNLEVGERATQVIMEESKRLTRIVEQFIQAARPSTPRFETRELRPLLESLERIFRPECEQAGIGLGLSLDPDLPTLFIDEHQLMQALRNLLRNAIEALGERVEAARQDEEDFNPRIELQAMQEGDFVNIIISDNGPGIGEGALEHIFEPYFTTKFGGSGLGLMVVYRIVSEHRGALHVDTRPGEGTRFIISLPLHKRPIRLLGHREAQEPVNTQEAQDNSKA